MVQHHRLMCWCTVIQVLLTLITTIRAGQLGRLVGIMCDYFEVSQVNMYDNKDQDIALEGLEATWIGSKAPSDSADVLNLVIGLDQPLPNASFQQNYWLFPKDFDLSGANLKLNSKVFTYDELDEGSNQIRIQEVYAFRGVPERKSIAFVDLVGGKVITASKESLWTRRGQLHGAVLVASCIPYGDLHCGTNEKGDVVGALMEILNIIGQAMNFTLEYQFEASGIYGVSDEHGNWNGVMGRLQREEVDLVAVLLALTRERHNVIDFTRPIMNEKVTLFSINRGQRQVLNLMAYADIFQAQSWLSVGLASFILGLGFLAIQRLGLEQNADRFSLTKAMALVLVLMIQRDFVIPQRRWTTRFTFITISLFGFLIFTSYSALLTSTMIFTPSELSIHTFDDMIDQNMKLFVWSGTSSHHTILAGNPGTSYYRANEKLLKGKPETLFQSIEEAYSKISADPNALAFVDSSIFSTLPNVMEVKNFKDTITYGLSIGFPKDSELSPFFDHFLLQLEQSGIRDLILKRWNILDSGHLGGLEQQGALALGYPNVFIPFAILVVGGLSCLVIWLFELSHSRKSSGNDSTLHRPDQRHGRKSKFLP